MSNAVELDAVKSCVELNVMEPDVSELEAVGKVS